MPTAVRMGVRWQIAIPDTACLFNQNGFRLDEWLATGQATVVKQRPRRSIYRVQLRGLDFHLKHDRPSASLARLLQTSNARGEFERGLALRERGIATPEPLAFGETLASSYVLTRTVDRAVPLDAFIEHQLPLLPMHQQALARQRIATELGKFLAQLHDAGVLHQDFHPGNLLLQWHQEQPRFWLIDLHAVHIASHSLGAAARRDNLIVLNRWFTLRSSRSDRLRCWRAYEAATVASSVPEGRRLERATLASNLRFWRRRQERFTSTNRYCRAVRNNDLVGFAVGDLPADALEPLLNRADTLFRDTNRTLLKDGRSSSVAVVTIPDPHIPRSAIWKRFTVTRWSDPFAALARPAAAMRSWSMGHALLMRLLPTPRPLAVVQRMRHGLPREGYLLTELIAPAVDLAQYVDAHGDRCEQLRPLIARLARLLRTMHDRHVSHRDLKAPNLLLHLDETGAEVREIYLIDLVGVRCHRKLNRARKVQNLARLHASFRFDPKVKRTDKLRFLRAYLAWGLRGKLGWKRWWREIEAATEIKVRRNLRRGRPLH